MSVRAIVQGVVFTLVDTEEVIPVNASMFTSAVTGGASKIVPILTAVASSLAIYKIFFEYVEANEMAVRARNNKPDYVHRPLEVWRLILYIVELITASVLIVTMVVGSVNGWILLGIALVDVAALCVTTITWPRTDHMKLVGPGFKVKVPGWISYKRAEVVVRTDRVVLTHLTDGGGHLINLVASYRWKRAADNGETLWRSINRVGDLRETLESELLVFIRQVVSNTPDVISMNCAGLDAIGDAIRASGSAVFYQEFGISLQFVGIGEIGYPPVQSAWQPGVRWLKKLLRSW